jgi:hypothetical protein
MSEWKAGMEFDSILQTPLDYYDVTYANGHTVRYEKARPHGEWLTEPHSRIIHCSNCGTEENLNRLYVSNFCYSCGADMRKKSPCDNCIDDSDCDRCDVPLKEGDEK